MATALDGRPRSFADGFENRFDVSDHRRLYRFRHGQIVRYEIAILARALGHACRHNQPCRARARVPLAAASSGALSVAGDTIGRMTETTAFDWRSFLLRWSGEWADSLPDNKTQSEDDETARRTRWLGFPPASAERIAAMERRLGCRMPPSYREFLKVSDGWRHAGGFVWLLAGTEDAR